MKKLKMGTPAMGLLIGTALVAVAALMTTACNDYEEHVLKGTLYADSAKTVAAAGDTLTFRAVASMKKILEWFKPCWPHFDRMLLVKGPKWTVERGEARHYSLMHGLALRKLKEYTTPGSDEGKQSPEETEKTTSPENPTEQENFKAKYGYELPSPPVTTDEVHDVAEFFTRKKGELLCGEPLTDDLYGITLMGKRHVSTWYNILNVLYVFGAREIEAEHGYEYGKITINSDKAVEALEWYKDMTQFCPPGLLQTDWDTSQANMQQGITVMGWEWDDATGAVENPDESVAAGKIAYTGLPIAPDGYKATQI